MPSYKIVMNFKNSGDKNTSMTISDARPEVTQVEAVAAMDAILTADIFRPSGLSLVSKVDCKLVETTESDFYDNSLTKEPFMGFFLYQPAASPIFSVAGTPGFSRW